MELDRLAARVTQCRSCPRLTSWREEVGRTKRLAFRDEEYWARPVPGFGDRAARLLVLGLAPAAHGANRTGRIFTGDRSGDWLYAALHRAGFANRPTAVHREDGLELYDAYITSPVKCAPPANRPLPEERDRCRPFLIEEFRALTGVRAIVCLGAFAWDQALWIMAEAGQAIPRPKPRFGHAVCLEIGPYLLIGSYHPSQQNTFTGRLTVAMFDDVFALARAAVAGAAGPVQDREAGGR